MNLLFRVLFAHGCRSTHHKLCMDALCHLTAHRNKRWQRLFLKHHKSYLAGSKAPDTEFKDFRNHVLHVRDNYWGGAAKSARKWYDQTVEALRQNHWESAVYNAGVVSHYYMDPIQPFHTGQTKAENNIHRAAEWSIAKAYDDIRQIILDRRAYPIVETPHGNSWLEDMVIAGAELSNPYYEELVEHYDLRRGTKDPPAGFDRQRREILATLVGHATIGFARILDRAIEDAGVTPPKVDVTIQGFLATLSIPIYWVTRKLDDQAERSLVEAMYRELKATGKVEHLLPEDDRAVRDLHQKEVINGQRPSGDYMPEKRTRPISKENYPRLARSPSRHIVATPRASERTNSPAPSVSNTSRTDIDPVRQKHAPSPRLNAQSLQSNERPRTHSGTSPQSTEQPQMKRKRMRKGKKQPHQDAEPTREKEPAVANDAAANKTASYAQETTPRHDSVPAPQPSELRFHLELTDAVVDAPSIGPKTARRMNRIGVKTVHDFLSLDPEEAAGRLGVRHIKADTIREWQDQTWLACQIPEIRGHDAQILVACGWTDPRQIATADPGQVFSVVNPFVDTNDGKRIIRSGRRPDVAEITNWITWAGHARQLRSA